jgi:hypothetical protein
MTNVAFHSKFGHNKLGETNKIVERMRHAVRFSFRIQQDVHVHFLILNFLLLHFLCSQTFVFCLVGQQLTNLRSQPRQLRLQLWWLCLQHCAGVTWGDTDKFPHQQGIKPTGNQEFITEGVGDSDYWLDENFKSPGLGAVRTARAAVRRELLSNERGCNRDISVNDENEYKHANIPHKFPTDGLPHQHIVLVLLVGPRQSPT